MATTAISPSLTALSLTSVNAATKNFFDRNVRSGSGGVLDGAAGQATTALTQHTQASVGDHANLRIAGAFSAQTNNSATAVERTHLDSGGVISIARSVSKANYQSQSVVEVGENADIASDGDILLGSWTVADITTHSNAKTFGFSGAAEGRAHSSVDIMQNTLIKGGASLRSEGNIALLAGTNGDD